MEQEPPRQQDPLALAVFGAALALLAGLLLYVFFFKAPEPAPAAGTAEFLEQARRQVAAVADRFQEKPETKTSPAPSAETSAPRHGLPRPPASRPGVPGAMR